MSKVLLLLFIPMLALCQSNSSCIANKDSAPTWAMQILGRGIDTVKQDLSPGIADPRKGDSPQLLGSAPLCGDVFKVPPSKSSVSVKYFENYQLLEMDSRRSYGGSAKGTYEGFSSDVNFKRQDYSKTTDEGKTVYLVVSLDAPVWYYRISARRSPTPDNDSNEVEFRRHYGDSYIDSITEGVRYRFVWKYASQKTEEIAEALQAASVIANYGDYSRATANTSVRETLKKFSNTISIGYESSGVSPLGVPISDPAAVIQRLDQISIKINKKDLTEIAVGFTGWESKAYGRELNLTLANKLEVANEESRDKVSTLLKIERDLNRSLVWIRIFAPAGDAFKNGVIEQLQLIEKLKGRMDRTGEYSYDTRDLQKAVSLLSAIANLPEFNVAHNVPSRLKIEMMGADANRTTTEGRNNEYVPVIRGGRALRMYLQVPDPLLLYFNYAVMRNFGRLSSDAKSENSTLVQTRAGEGWAYPRPGVEGTGIVSLEARLLGRWAELYAYQTCATFSNPMRKEICNETGLPVSGSHQALMNQVKIELKIRPELQFESKP